MYKKLKYQEIKAYYCYLYYDQTKFKNEWKNRLKRMKYFIYDKKNMNITQPKQLKHVVYQRNCTT